MKTETLIQSCSQGHALIRKRAIPRYLNPVCHQVPSTLPFLSHSPGDNPDTDLVDEGSKLVVETFDLLFLLVLHALRLGVDLQVEGREEALVDRHSGDTGWGRPAEPPCPVAKASPSSERPRTTHCDPRRPHCTQALAAKAPEMTVAGAPGAAPAEDQAIGKAMHPRLGHNS